MLQKEKKPIGKEGSQWRYAIPMAGPPKVWLLRFPFSLALP
jgi:hypothetical protein